MMRGLLLCFVAASCAYTDSENVRSSGIFAYYTVTHDARDRVDIGARFTVGGPTGTILVLSGADHFEVNGQMIRGLSTEIAPSSDSTYDLTLVRSDEAITTTVKIPALPAILSTTPDATVRDGDPLTLHWDVTSPGTQVQLSISGTCVKPLSVLMGDSGTYTTPPLRSETNHELETCPIKVDLLRGAGGSADSAFQGGYVDTHREVVKVLEFRGIAAS